MSPPIPHTPYSKSHTHHPSSIISIIRIVLSIIITTIIAPIHRAYGHRLNRRPIFLVSNECPFKLSNQECLSCCVPVTIMATQAAKLILVHNLQEMSRIQEISCWAQERVKLHTTPFAVKPFHPWTILPSQKLPKKNQRNSSWHLWRNFNTRAINAASFINNQQKKWIYFQFLLGRHRLLILIGKVVMAKHFELRGSERGRSRHGAASHQGKRL